MFKFASATLLATLVAAPVLAASTTQKLDFARDGVHYVGTITETARGARRITGYEVESGRAFALDVVNGRVSGRYDGQAVSYDAPTLGRSAGVTTLASAGGN